MIRVFYIFLIFTSVMLGGGLVADPIEKIPKQSDHPATFNGLLIYKTKYLPELRVVVSMYSSTDSKRRALLITGDVSVIRVSESLDMGLPVKQIKIGANSLLIDLATATAIDDELIFDAIGS